jgi:phosphate transport system substrate-binding protein
VSNGFAKCPQCEYGHNPAQSRTCEHCGASLSRRNAPILVILLGLAVLGIVGMGAFFIRGQQDSIEPLVNSAQPDVEGVGGSQLQNVGVQTYRQYIDVPDVPKGVFNYGGSTTFAPLRSPNVIKTIATAFPQFKLRYTEPPIGNAGSGRGIEMLIEGQLSFSQSSRGLKAQELAQAKLMGYPLEEIPIAIDGIALYVNPQVINGALKGLTLAQVSDIFTGKVKNWKDFGGSDLKIIPISRNRQAGGTVDFFFEHVLQKQPFGATVREVLDTTEGLRIVASTPGAISYATASEVIKQRTVLPLGIAKDKGQNFIWPCGDTACTTVNAKAFTDASYPITRRLFIVIKRDRKLDEQAGVAYANLMLSDEGQASVRQAGFIPIR